MREMNKAQVERRPLLVVNENPADLLELGVAPLHHPRRPSAC